MPRWLKSGLGFVIGFVAMPILGSLFTRAVGAYYGHPGRDVKQVTALAAVRQLTNALDRFRQEHQRIPTATEGLAALVPQYLERVPADPWNHPFVYVPSSDGLWADVMSYGADGESAGSGAAADVSGRFGMLKPRPPPYVTWLGDAATLVVPLIGLLGARRSEWASSLLAGSGSLCAVLLLALVNGLFEPALLLPLVAGLVCLAGSIAVLRHVPGAPMLTFSAIVAARLLLEELVSI